MTTHITNSSKEVLSKLEASLLNITSKQRERLNFIGSLNSSFFSGAGIAKELVKLKEYWIDFIPAGNPVGNLKSEYHEFRTWEKLFQVRNYLSKDRHIQILIVTNQPVKLKNILKVKKWNQTKTEILKRGEIWKYIDRGYFPQPEIKIMERGIINVQWDKI